jgi:hypothetical protein
VREQPFTIMQEVVAGSSEVVKHESYKTAVKGIDHFECVSKSFQ